MRKSLYVKGRYLLFYLLALHAIVEAKPAEISMYDVTSKMHEIMKEHATYKKMSPVLARRALHNFILLLDPQKAYFLESDIRKWLDPSEDLLQQITKDFEYSRFAAFEEIFALMEPSIQRRMGFEDRISKAVMPRNVNGREFRDAKWCKTEEELYQRLLRMRAFQIETTKKLDEDLRAQTVQLLMRGRIQNEQKRIPKDKTQQKQLFCTYLLKALASSLDAHTVYFTPAEANQFLIAVQQRLTGIGIQLRDDIDGFTIIKVIEDGPADVSGDVRVGDKIIAIDREPIIGLDSIDVVEMIRGPEGSQVSLTILREIVVGESHYTENKEIRLLRGDVVIKDSRVEITAEPFADSSIAIIKLHSFYQDSESSSTSDMVKGFEKLKREQRVKGVILDLRCNAGGLLTEAVGVVGLFIKKGIVASTKDENGHIEHFRNIDGKLMWDGPLIVMVDRLSASAAEVVAQALQDYGRAIIIGEDHSYGKGTFQTFTLTSNGSSAIDPQGEYKVTRGRYYTVSGKTPQLVGVQSDIVVPGGLSFLEVGEEYAKYPLENDGISPNFIDSLNDVSYFQRDRIRRLYQTDKQLPLTKFREHLELLNKNSSRRLASNKLYKRFLEHCKKLEQGLVQESFPPSDFQMQEGVSVMKDFICLLQEKGS